MVSVIGIAMSLKSSRKIDGVNHWSTDDFEMNSKYHNSLSYLVMIQILSFQHIYFRFMFYLLFP